MQALGKHLLVEYYDCNVDVLNDVRRVEKAMCEAAEICGATIVQSVFHAFNPVGVSGVVVIAESHLAIHTWPEYAYAAVDVFTCGDTVKPEVAEEALRRMFGAGRVEIRDVPRGKLQPTGGKLAHKIEVPDAHAV